MARTSKIVVALVLVAAAAVATVAIVERRSTASERAAVLTAEAFASAWQEQDWTALAATVTGDATEVAPGVHERMLAELEATGVEVALDGVMVADDQARARYVADLQLTGFGDWSYQGEFSLRRQDGEWAVAWEPRVAHPDLDDGLGFAVAHDWRERAPILGADGSALVDDEDVVVVGVEPQRVEDPDALTRALVQVAGAAPERVATLLEDEDLRQDWFHPVVELSTADFAAVDAELRPVPGVLFQSRSGRAPIGTAGARAILGTLEAADAERAEGLGSPYQLGRPVGASGLELAYEEQLAGRPRTQIQLVRLPDAPVTSGDEPGGGEEPVAQVRRVLAERDPVAPRPLRTLMDLGVQAAAEAALADLSEPAALVAVDLATGGIRAAANAPAGGFDRALGGRYPPGSTFKVVTAAAAIADGVRPDTIVGCPGETKIGGRGFTNAGDAALGVVPFRTIFAESCNTGFIALAQDLGAERLDAVAESFGFDVEYTTGVGGFAASFPVPDTAVDLAAASIGQARVEASPAHMASVAAAAVTGTWRSPILIEGVAQAERQVPGDPEILGSLMRQVVTAGTGRSADPGGEPLRGKTGSAEFGAADPPESHAWFIGVRGDLAVAVVIEGGGAGGSVAGPVVADFYQAVDGS